MHRPPISLKVSVSFLKTANAQC